MKLYPIIYTEGARTAAEALNKGVAALLVSSTETGLKKIVLFDIDRAKKAISKAGDFDNALIALGNRAIVGVVSYSPVHGIDDIYKVSTSAGVSKFGPLTYQLVMASIKPAWLRSDTSLTEGEASSSNVWNKMYSMPETYERKWLGEFDKDSMLAALRATDTGFMLFRGYKHGTTEEEITRFLEKNKESITNFGHLYVYRLRAPDSKIKSMYESGQAFLDEMQQQGFDQEEIKSVMYDAATMFFERRYA